MPKNKQLQISEKEIDQIKKTKICLVFFSLQNNKKRMPLLGINQVIRRQKACKQS